MNIYHTEPRFDCEKFAPCGRISLHKCRKYKDRLDECRGCTLVRRKTKTVAGTEAGRKVCPHCGRSLPLHRFYNRTVRYEDKEYRCLTSWCKMCISEVAAERNRNN